MNIKSAWLSKINWTAAVTALLTLAAALGLPITDEMKVNIMAFIGTVGPVAIMIWKTFFTTTITPSSASNMP